MIYHVLNRANARRPFFDSATDFAAFEQVLSEAQQEYPVPLLAFCVMPNHWHLVLAPRKDGELSRFTGWLTLTHTQGAAKPPLSGMPPNSTYVQVRPGTGQPVQYGIYNGNGQLIGHFDPKPAPGLPFGHGHQFPPGNPAPGHGPGAPHISPDQLPWWWHPPPPGGNP